MTAAANASQSKRLSAGEIITMALTRPARTASEDIEIIENAKHELQVKVSCSRREDESDEAFRLRAVAMWSGTRELLDAGLPVRDNGSTPFDD